MKLLFKLLATLGLAIIGVVLSYQYNNIKASEQPLDFSTTVYGVAKQKYPDLELVPATEETKEQPQAKGNTGEHVEINAEEKSKDSGIEKYFNKMSDDYLGAIFIPVLKTSEAIYRGSGDYYLNYDYRKRKNEVGEVYLDDRTSDNLISSGSLLNGHAVPNGTKFGAFKNLLKVDKQPEFYIYNHADEKTYKYKMLFISLVDAKTSGLVMEFSDDYHRYSYYKTLYQTAIKQWEEPKVENDFILLNSCSYIIDNGRYLIISRLESVK